MITLHNVEKRFPTGFCLRIPDLCIADGERVAVIGTNGSGKSTLLRLLAGIITPDAGTVTVTPPGTRVGYQPQNAYAFRGAVTANVRLAAAKDADLAAVLKRCRLEEFADKNARLLSGGEKQRMFLARMLAGNFDCLLLDEPFSAADIEMSDVLCGVLTDVCRERGTTLLMATHLPAQALGTATKILLLNDGEVAEYSDAENLTHPASDFGKKFVSRWKL